MIKICDRFSTQKKLRSRQGYALNIFLDNFLGLFYEEIILKPENRGKYSEKNKKNTVWGGLGGSTPENCGVFSVLI